MFICRAYYVFFRSRTCQLYGDQLLKRYQGLECVRAHNEGHTLNLGSTHKL